MRFTTYNLGFARPESRLQAGAPERRVILGLLRLGMLSLLLSSIFNLPSPTNAQMILEAPGIAAFHRKASGGGGGGGGGGSSRLFAARPEVPQETA